MQSLKSKCSKLSKRHLAGFFQCSFKKVLLAFVMSFCQKLWYIRMKNDSGRQYSCKNINFHGWQVKLFKKLFSFSSSFENLVRPDKKEGVTDETRKILNFQIERSRKKFIKMYRVNIEGKAAAERRKLEICIMPLPTQNVQEKHAHIAAASLGKKLY